MTLRNTDHRTRSLLVIDDDSLFGDAVIHLVTDAMTNVGYAPDLSTARELNKDGIFDVILLDNNLPDGSGIDLIPEILGINDQTKIILVTAFPSFDHAVKAIKMGAYDYISKPVDSDELHATVQRAFQANRLEAVEQVTVYQNAKKRSESILVGFTNPRHNIRELIEKAALTKASVLITGETGTGKNVIAKMIHHRGHSVTSPLININCAALPETLIESELFGVEKGAFTGASQTRKGLLELADGGSVFLDEIGEMPPALQAKLLSSLEDRHIRRVGGSRDRAINVRILAATNAEPEKAIEAGTFRRDLFYRLSVIRLHLPPLRERKEDIPELCSNFISHFAHNRSVKIGDGELEKLNEYHFPGNVRELRNIIERSLILQEGDRIFPSRLIESGSTPKFVGENSNLLDTSLKEDLTLPQLEELYIIAALNKHGNNLTRTALALDISLSTLKRKVQSIRATTID